MLISWLRNWVPILSLSVMKWPVCDVLSSHSIRHPHRVLKSRRKLTLRGYLNPHTKVSGVFFSSAHSHQHCLMTFFLSLAQSCSVCNYDCKYILVCLCCSHVRVWCMCLWVWAWTRELSSDSHRRGRNNHRVTASWHHGEGNSSAQHVKV